MSEKTSADKPPQRSKNGERARRILGPVPNLEEYVRPDWWRGIFNSIYLKTDADVVDDENITRTEIDLFLDTLNLSPEDRILDLCCGQGRHSQELARRGFKNVEGLDRSSYLIQKAKKNAQQQLLTVKFREGDARKLPYAPDTFDVIMILGNSFGYFETVKDDLRVLQEVFRILKPWGKLLIDVTDGEYVKKHFQPRSWEWIDKKLFVCRERSLSADKQRLISREVVTHVGKGVIADQFYAERLYTRRSLGELIRTAGFSDCTIHGEISPNSRRNQDLGMMEQRIITTALVRKEWTPLRAKSNGVARNVVVIMGDPHKPDPLKPSSVFDDDDFYTIDQLKDALRELDEYRFSYLSKHDSLIHDMRRLAGRADLVFNLCDEGFGNDPRKELHVPALLEALEIPYTGARPQCLAYCYDKSLVRGIASEMEIPVPKAFFIKPEDTKFELPFGFPVIVKPNFGDSSFGITQRCVANSLEELLNAISEIREQFGYDKPILAEEFLTGKDLSVGIIGNPSMTYNVLPITEEDYSAVPEDLPRICGYEAKWRPDSPYWNIKSIRAQLPEETERSIVEWCLKLFERLECRDYARLDWRLDAEGNPRLLEVNPNPGWCWDGHLAKMAKIAGMSYSQMLEAILRAAELRLGIHGSEVKREEEQVVRATV
ncbi:MAG: methyltransferase domain-containing protein [Candidatus Lindowbacteria bacterium]|nr:methyltransferase domain-containing protein [Candidatus Lindowbacteria bacterium]